MNDDHRDGCQCHGCVCSRYELEIHSLTNDIEHERTDAARYREDLAVVTREALKTIDSLKADLAEREAECLKLRECLSNCIVSDINQPLATIAVWRVKEALSTPPSTSYLEQWEKERYGEPVGYLDSTGRYQSASYKNNDVLPLYARKD